MAYKDNVYSGAPKTTVRNENLLFVHCSPTVVVLFFTLGHWPIFHAKHCKDIFGGKSQTLSKRNQLQKFQLSQQILRIYY